MRSCDIILVKNCVDENKRATEFVSVLGQGVKLLVYQRGV